MIHFCGPISDYLDKDVLLLNISLGQFVFCSLSPNLKLPNESIRNPGFGILEFERRRPGHQMKKTKKTFQKKQQKSWNWVYLPTIGNYNQKFLGIISPIFFRGTFMNFKVLGSKGIYKMNINHSCRYTSPIDPMGDTYLGNSEINS